MAPDHGSLAPTWKGYQSARLRMRGSGRELRKDVIMWWNHDIGWVGWLAMTLGMAGFWVVIALIVVALVRTGRQPVQSDLDPRQILQQRLARGDIDLDEYHDRLAALESAPSSIASAHTSGSAGKETRA